MQLSNEDKKTIAAILRTHIELQDRRALDGTQVLSRLQLDEPNNPLTIEVARSLKAIEEDCQDLERIANLVEADIV